MTEDDHGRGADDWNGSPGAEVESPLTLLVSPLPEATAEDIAVGERYWRLDGFEPVGGTGRVRATWTETAQTLAQEAGEAASRLYVVAGAGVAAVLPTVECATC